VVKNVEVETGNKQLSLLFLVLKVPVLSVQFYYVENLKDIRKSLQET